MYKKEKISFIVKTLQKLYPKVTPPLHHSDNYTLLIAVLLSAQSTDAGVNKVTPLLFSKADNPYKMVKLKISEIRNIIKPVGLSPIKAKGIHGLSKIIIEKHNGEVPKDFKSLEELPSVGHKTASVVMSQAFGVPAFPVDTHIHRMMYRWVFQLEKCKKLKLTLKGFPKNLWNKLHLQIIFYAREFSPARGWNIDKDIITIKLKKRTIKKRNN